MDIVWSGCGALALKYEAAFRENEIDKTVEHLSPLEPLRLGGCDE